MNRTVNKYSLKRYLILFFAIAAFVVTGTNPAKAFQNKKADTVSSADVQFTNIPTAADSLKAFKKKQAELKNADSLKALKNKQAVVNAVPAEKPKTLWEIFIKGLLGGFTAILLPCIYPLLPLTVSFFTKKSGSRAKGVLQSLLYGLSIIVIYVSLGMLISVLFGSDALNALATNGIFNIFFFLLLVVFGISFLGAFEITLPSSLANKLDANSDKGGLAGIFFMASTLVVVSFSCTGPVIGTLLVDAASKGDRLGPAVGMLGFSLALALPFTIFALFPSALKSLPKSGGWLNSVKVVLGFLELAFALKFLSNVDLAYHWNWFDREIFLSIWIAIGLLMGLYLIGKIKFSHDSDLPYLSVPRTFISIGVFAFVIYMIPGLWGAPLKSISAFLPPIATQDFDLSQIPANTAATADTKQSSIKVKKYAGNYDRIKTRGLDAWFDYDQALQVSKELHKPILIDFTGFNCVNCRKMESDVWTNPQVFNHLRNDFILLQLVVDDKAALETKEQFTSEYSGKKITNLGGKWSDLEASRFNSNSQPLYVILDSDGNLMNDKDGKLITPSPAEYHVDLYLKYLESGLEAYKNKK
ncbi:protein-disulfide reductase DsbD family protein [Mucilaginibacter flavidus]|uniref:protein-disulfide reductase DsbD family protein n=1 Tax=Mucilaginibacter flavidus TaxID=2949309 RepID=UPI0020933DBB|nr:cytochrome c biogenesis protein CcdA [Mucilaginibacter flavidus]MCO5948943.1 thioredoxin family protein [Mucilaginibacter flavidus]